MQKCTSKGSEEKYHKLVNTDVINAGFKILCKCFMKEDRFVTPQGYTQYFLASNPECQLLLLKGHF